MNGTIGRMPPLPDAEMGVPWKSGSDGMRSEEKNSPLWSTHWKFGMASAGLVGSWLTY